MCWRSSYGCSKARPRWRVRAGGRRCVCRGWEPRGGADGSWWPGRRAPLRLLGGQVGVLGQDGAFGNDGRFHPLPAYPELGYGRCTPLDRHGRTYLAGLPRRHRGGRLRTWLHAAVEQTRPRRTGRVSRRRRAGTGLRAARAAGGERHLRRRRAQPHDPDGRPPGGLSDRHGAAAGSARSAQASASASPGDRHVQPGTWLATGQLQRRTGDHARRPAPPGRRGGRSCGANRSSRSGRSSTAAG